MTDSGVSDEEISEFVTALEEEADEQEVLVAAVDEIAAEIDTETDASIAEATEELTEAGASDEEIAEVVAEITADAAIELSEA